MELTRYDRERLAELTGAVSLAGHAVAAGWFAKLIFGLPMEAGGLILAPIIGLPLAVAAFALVNGALLLAFRRPGEVPLGGLVVTLGADLVALAAVPHLRHPLLVLGAALSAASLAFFVSLVRFDLSDDDHTDVVLAVVGVLLAGVLLVVGLPRLVGL